MKYLLDTTVLSEPLPRRPNVDVVRHLEEHRGEPATAPTARHEMLLGCHRSPPSARRAAIQRYIDEAVFPSAAILPYHAGSARWHAEERARLTGTGRTPFADGQITSVARTNGLVLVTSNVSSYAGFENPRVEDWRAG